MISHYLQAHWQSKGTCSQAIHLSTESHKLLKQTILNHAEGVGTHGMLAVHDAFLQIRMLAT
jgi:hypothetical protein